ncbi:MAG TPA: penicillin acylase family protein, partial [Chitinophagaceae bacterium]|nr:penicillin acylase family protein [Chitinophagaceae bacterium]
VGIRNNKWLALKAQNRSLQGLMQSWLRTKAKDLAEFTKVMEMRANTSTNTMYADDMGNIAYWHGNFIPKRNGSYNWALPVDGSTPATEWQGLHDLNEIFHAINPKEGWMQNCNSSPFNLSGFNSISANAYPSYMAPEGDNFRSQYAIKQLSALENATIEKMIALGYDHYLSAFDSLLPPLIKDFDALPVMDPVHNNVKEAIESLRNWDKRSSASSIATTIGVFWAYQVLSKNFPGMPGTILKDQVKMFTWNIQHHSSQERLDALQAVLSGLQNKLGSWKIPWGEITRFQRLSGDIRPKFDAGESSLPVGLGSSVLGSLPSYEAAWLGSKMYGTAGNSFVAVVEFGKRVTARSIVTGGSSFQPGSKHFLDQAQMYIDGKFKDVFFYKGDIVKNGERTYHPGGE